MNVAIVVVLFRSEMWTRRLLPQLSAHLPEVPLVFVDNNVWRSEGRYAGQFGSVIQKRGKASHGSGLDLALESCRSWGHDVMVHVEPDCTVGGRRWYDNLIDSIAAENAMVSGFRKQYGPLHPTPSAWDVGFDWETFDVTPRGTDVSHPEFKKLFDLEVLRFQVAHQPRRTRKFFETNWDTAQRNWFLAARNGRATLVECPDFTHHWFGSKRGPHALGPESVLDI